MFKSLRNLALLALATIAVSAFADPVGKVIPQNSEALTLNTDCGAPGVGKLPDGQWYKGYLADTGNAYDELGNLRYGTAAVDSNGNWFLCQSWVKPGESPNTPQPNNLPCTEGANTHLTWTGFGGVACRADKMFTGARAGETFKFTSDDTGRLGHATFVCQKGKMVLQPGADCFQQPECSGSIEMRWGVACKGSFTGYMAAGAKTGLLNTTAGYSGKQPIWCNPGTMRLETTGDNRCVKD